MWYLQLGTCPLFNRNFRAGQEGRISDRVGDDAGEVSAMCSRFFRERRVFLEEKIVEITE